MRIPRITAGIQSVAVVTFVFTPRLGPRQISRPNQYVRAHSRIKQRGPVGGPCRGSLLVGLGNKCPIGLCEFTRPTRTFRSTLCQA